MRNVFINPVTEEEKDINNSFPDNTISNTKYTFWNFLPKNIFEQFSRSHLNRFFLLIAIIQLWKEIAPANPMTIWLPLIVATGITALKAGIDDFNRWRRDRKANLKKYYIFDRKVTEYIDFFLLFSKNNKFMNQ